MKYLTQRILALALAASALHGVNAKADPIDCSKVDPALRLRIGVDIGSGSSKARSFVVNPGTQKILPPGWLEKGGVSIKWRAHLTRNGSDGQFEKAFMDDGVNKIVAMVDGVRAATLKKLESKPELAQYLCLKDRVEVHGVATEAFRQSKNTDAFLAAMKEKGIEVTVLTQPQEGMAGFMGVMALVGSDPSAKLEASDFLSWDIGGASLQIVGYNSGGKGAGLPDTNSPWYYFGNQLASDPMRVFVLKNVLGKPANTPDNKPASPNPILISEGNPKAAAQSKYLMEESAVFVAGNFRALTSSNWVSPLVSRGNARTVYGIGGVHNSILDSLKRLPGYESAKSYTAKDLSFLISKMLPLSDEQINVGFKVPLEFAGGATTNVLMVYQVMNLLKVGEVKVVDVDNSYAAVINPRFWPKSENATAQSGATALVEF